MENQYIRQVAHQPNPVSIEREEGDVIVIEGVRYSGDYFRAASIPK